MCVCVCVRACLRVCARVCECASPSAGLCVYLRVRLCVGAARAEEAEGGARSRHILSDDPLVFIRNTDRQSAERRQTAAGTRYDTHTHTHTHRTRYTGGNPEKHGERERERERSSERC